MVEETCSSKPVEKICGRVGVETYSGTLVHETVQVAVETYSNKVVVVETYSGKVVKGSMQMVLVETCSGRLVEKMVESRQVAVVETCSGRLVVAGTCRGR